MNIDISFNIRVMDLNFSVCGYNILLEGIVPQFLYLGLNFDFMSFFNINLDMNLALGLTSVSQSEC